MGNCQVVGGAHTSAIRFTGCRALDLGNCWRCGCSASYNDLVSLGPKNRWRDPEIPGRDYSNFNAQDITPNTRCCSRSNNGTATRGLLGILVQRGTVTVTKKSHTDGEFPPHLTIGRLTSKFFCAHCFSLQCRMWVDAIGLWSCLTITTALGTSGIPHSSKKDAHEASAQDFVFLKKLHDGSASQHKPKL
jgi:hypothetical protein